MAPFMPKDGVFGWTFSLPFEKKKIFSSLNKEEGTYVCRTHKWEPDKHEKTPRVALQMLSGKQNINRVSLVDIDTDHKTDNVIEKLMERYFGIEEKVNVFTMFRDDFLYILKPFPSCSKDIFNDVSQKLKDDPGKIAERLETLEDFNFRFFCGCSSEKISRLFSGLKEDDKDFLFQKDDTVTAECPRCGKKYTFKRDDI